MNFRITMFFFGLLLTTLWVFGLMIAYKKSAVDPTVLIPSLQLPDVKIDQIVFKRYDQEKDKELPEVEFKVIGDRWFLIEGKQQARVEGFRIEDMLKQIKTAKNDETEVVPKDPKHHGLKQPQVTVTLSGKLKDDAKTWTLRIGTGTKERGTVFVEVSGGAGDNEAGGDARAALGWSDTLAGAVPVDPLGQVRAASPSVVELELIDSIDGKQLVAGGAPQPARERRDGDPDVAEGVASSAGVER